MRLIYSFILFPLLFLGAHLAALFSSTMRKPLLARYGIFKQIREWKKNGGFVDSQKTVIIHAASMGEFEHIKPLIRLLSKDSNLNIAVTFFSPSGYNHVKSFAGVGLFLYLPFDFKWIWKKFYKITQASVLLISKHDVWPNQVHAAKSMSIPSILINASLGEKSGRNSWFSKLVLAEGYRNLDKIFSISDIDSERLKRSFRCTNTETAGDTKFDQVLKRKEQALSKNLLDESWLDGKIILIFGSLWPQDAEHVLKNIPRILGNNTNLKIIIVPHQPTEEILNGFRNHLDNIEFNLFTDPVKSADSRVIIVNTIGVLADMYKYGHLAYVGGSFKQGIHNVMEPAIYGIPVLFGPFYKNAYEAGRLLAFGGGISISNEKQFEENLQSLLNDPQKRKEIGTKALQFAQKNTGKSAYILDYIKRILNN